MVKNKEKECIERWGFKTKATFEKSIHKTIEDLEFIAPRIFILFNEKVA